MLGNAIEYMLIWCKWPKDPIRHVFATHLISVWFTMFIGGNSSNELLDKEVTQLFPGHDAYYSLICIFILDIWYLNHSTCNKGGDKVWFLQVRKYSNTSPSICVDFIFYLMYSLPVRTSYFWFIQTIQIMYNGFSYSMDQF